MKVYILMQSEGRGVARVRDIYLNKKDAEDFIGTPQKPTIKCDDCGQQKPNPKYYDNTTEHWKNSLFIKERTVK